MPEPKGLSNDIEIRAFGYIWPRQTRGQMVAKPETDDGWRIAAIARKTFASNLLGEEKRYLG